MSLKSCLTDPRLAVTRHPRKHQNERFAGCGDWLFALFGAGCSRRRRRCPSAVSLIDTFILVGINSQDRAFSILSEAFDNRRSLSSAVTTTTNAQQPCNVLGRRCAEETRTSVVPKLNPHKVPRQ